MYAFAEASNFGHQRHRALVSYADEHAPAILGVKQTFDKSAYLA